MFGTGLIVKHAPQDGIGILIASYLFTVQIMAHLIVVQKHMHVLQHLMVGLISVVMQICFMPP